MVEYIFILLCEGKCLFDKLAGHFLVTDSVNSSAFICSAIIHSNVLSKAGGGGRGRARNNILVYNVYRWWPHSII